ncbi:MAG: AAA family ATPase [Alphaproteobacteria bacterium]|nr:AAA family ATPase [Alphaproteobacteria bacterium]
MPFLNHFNLTDYPFALTPNTSLFYPADHAQAVLAALVFSVQRGDGLLKVVGPVGSGKTMLCRMLLERLEVLPVNTAYLSAPAAVAPGQLPAQVLREFGLCAGNESDASALHGFLLGEHARGKRNVLIVDEAQALGPGGLEAVRLLSNLETSTHKLLQIILFGQAELNQLLRRSDLRQIAQRLSFSFVTQPLSIKAASAYVKFRMERCTKDGMRRVSFSPKALTRLARASGGLPRVIHILADKAMLALYAEGGRTVEPRHVRIAVRETPDARSFWRPLRLPKAA